MEFGVKWFAVFELRESEEDLMHTKLPKLALNQETLRNLTGAQRGNNFAPTFPPLCNTKFLSCPECNPPDTTG
jgi:hypothetical protein